MRKKLRCGQRCECGLTLGPLRWSSQIFCSSGCCRGLFGDCFVIFVFSFCLFVVVWDGGGGKREGAFFSFFFFFNKEGEKGGKSMLMVNLTQLVLFFFLPFFCLFLF